MARCGLATDQIISTTPPNCTRWCACKAGSSAAPERYAAQQSEGFLRLCFMLEYTNEILEDLTADWATRQTPVGSFCASSLATSITISPMSARIRYDLSGCLKADHALGPCIELSFDRWQYGHIRSSADFGGHVSCAGVL